MENIIKKAFLLFIIFISISGTAFAADEGITFNNGLVLNYGTESLEYNSIPIFLADGSIDVAGDVNFGNNDLSNIDSINGITDTEINYLDGITSNIQTQINTIDMTTNVSTIESNYVKFDGSVFQEKINNEIHINSSDDLQTIINDNTNSVIVIDVLGDYTVSSTINLINNNVIKGLGYGTNIKPSGDFDVIHMDSKYSKLEDITIDVSGISGYSSNAVVFTDNIGYPQGWEHINNVQIKGTPYSQNGDAGLAMLDDSGSGITWVQINNLGVTGFNYGILMNCSSTTGGYINGNYIYNTHFKSSYHGLFQDSYNESCAIDGNYFELQSNGHTSMSTFVINDGDRNRYDTILYDPHHLIGQKAYIFTNESDSNYVFDSTISSFAYLENKGTNNIIEVQNKKLFGFETLGWHRVDNATLTIAGRDEVGAYVKEPNFLMINPSTSVENGESFGKVNFYSRDSSTDGEGYVSRIESIAERDFTGGGRDAGIAFSTIEYNDVDVSERMRIASNGYVGIGTTNPQHLLEVAGSANISGTLKTQRIDISAPTATSGEINFNVDDGSDTRIRFQENDTSRWTIHRDNFYSGIGNEILRITNESGSDVIYFEPNGTVNIPNNLVVSLINGLISNTELNYLNGVSSNIQTQINGKLSTSGGTLFGNLGFTGGDITGFTNIGGISLTELNYLNGSRSNIQDQIDTIDMRTNVSAIESDYVKLDGSVEMEKLTISSAPMVSAEFNLESPDGNDRRLKFRENDTTIWTFHSDNNYGGVGSEVLRFENASGTDVIYLQQSGEVAINNLKGTYSGGSAYVCVYDNGEIYASETACP